MELDARTGAYFIALILTTGIALIVMIALNQPLRRFLLRVSASPERVDLLTRWSQILVMLVPAFMITASAGFVRPETEHSLIFGVLAHIAWSVAGLIVAVFGVGIWAVGVEGNRAGVVSVSPDQVDDLQRLLAKVEQLRAREVLARELQQNHPQ